MAFARKSDPFAAGTYDDARGNVAAGVRSSIRALSRRTLVAWRGLALSVVATVAAVGFAEHLGVAYPLRHWLAWRYAIAWACSLFFGVACLSVGDVAVRSLLGARLRASEHLPVAFAAGVYCFALGTFAGGALGAFGTPFFLGFPALLVALNGRSLAVYLGRLHAHGYFRPARITPLGALAYGLGGLSLLYLYAGVLTPENVAYDARWYHLPMAEHYVANHGVERFHEGWLLGAYPQFVTLLYTWALQLPFGKYWDRVELAAHVEFLCFVATLWSARPLVRALVPRVSGRHAWAFTFLFPGIFLYDANLNVSADHVTALFAGPLWLALLRAWPRLEPRKGVLLGALAAAAQLTKYTAVLLVLPVGSAVLLRGMFLAVRSAWRRDGAGAGRAIRGALVVLGAGIVFTAPHWLKNWIWYRDPIYPLSYAHLPLRPWHPDATTQFEKFSVAWFQHPPRTLAGFEESLKAAFTFSFGVFDKQPGPYEMASFGSLFTLSLVALPLLGKRLRLWSVYVAVHVAVVAWHSLHHFDRYLQALVPWMAAATLATTVLVFRQGLAAKVTWTALLVLQGVWGADIPFWPQHAMMYWDTPLRVSAKLFGRAHQNQFEERLVVSEYEAVGAATPPDAKVLIHDWHMHWGLQRRAVNDWSPYQGSVSWGTLATPGAVYDHLKAYGVTHLYYSRGPNALDNDSVASQLVFHDFAWRHGQGGRDFGNFRLVAMPAARPPEPGRERFVAYYGCGRLLYQSGRYRLLDMRQVYDLPYAAPADSVPRTDDELAASADFAVVESCRGVPQGVSDRFELVYRRDYLGMWVKR